MAMSHWIEICAAPGLPAGKMPPIDVYTIAKKILDDEPLRQLVVPSKLVNGVLPISARAIALRAMPDEQRAALRARIGWRGLQK